MIIILCYNRFVCMKQAFRRNFEYKGKVRESIAKGCKEKMDPEFFYWLIWKQYSKARKTKFASIKAKYRKNIPVEIEKGTECFSQYTLIGKTKGGLFRLFSIIIHFIKTKVDLHF